MRPTLSFLALGLVAATAAAAGNRPPNVIVILADDLGYRDLGAYGNTKIRTPNLDRLAAEGMKFSQFYSGSTVCAPSRCALLTGRHMGHAWIRDNGELPTEGQRPIPAGTETIGRMLQRAGYRTAVIGKWGLGGPGSTGEPNLQGFDHWFGYLCQRIAHNYYPPYLWRDGEKYPLPGNGDFSAHQKIEPATTNPADYARFSGKQYAPDLMIDDALEFVKENRERPFFLYFATTVPHLALQVPEDSLKEYLGKFPEEPYAGDHSYLPHWAPRAAYAAMITRMDRDLGRLFDTVSKLGLDDDTLILFTSDNGPTVRVGGADSEFFESAGELRGLKMDLNEGGIRVPLIARWKGRIKPGSSSDLVCAQWDLLATIAEAAGASPQAETDGLSIMPTLLGTGEQPKHEYLYWEFSSRRGRQAVRMGRWKGVRGPLQANPEAPIELYDLETDVSEAHDVASEHPQIVERIKRIMKEAHVDSELFPLAPPPAPSLPDADVIPSRGWRVVRFDSEHEMDGKTAACAIDGDPDTWWHTKWLGEKPPHPHELLVDLGDRTTFSGLRCVPRGDRSRNGMIQDFELRVGDSPDAVEKVAARGRLSYTSSGQPEIFWFAPCAGRYVLLRTLSEVNGAPYASLGELQLIRPSGDGD